jgi:RNA polymerase sigma-70 factor (ECF subfamily)
MDKEKDFLALIEMHQGIIHKVSALYMSREENRADLFQEILLAAWKGYDNFRGDAKFSTWLYRVALNTAVTWYRKDQKVEPVESLETIHANLPATDMNAEEQLQAMRKAITGLSPIDKALVSLYLDDYDYREIGEILGMSANNVAVKMNRIKNKLKQTTLQYL